MNKYLDATQFAELQQQLSSGARSIEVDRHVARQIFTKVPNKSIVETTGRSMLLQKQIVIAGIALPLVLMAACFVATLLLLGGFSLLLIPLLGIFWTIVAGLTGHRGNWVHTAIGLIFGLAFSVLVGIEYGVPLAFLTVSLALHRATYLLADRWITSLVSESFGAYDMLVEHLTIRDADRSDQAPP